ncbi:hypothetical protein TL16_g02017 [Triparma laevis f. inornata]|uniref:Uncharacterized protein n=1 Tax=Triparma laevis f. inornata TaxID=1714386 RepID=A0A9W7DZ13_9STRA|nr:hypothetical protein TL16_g02017 [Triparma laevis f. inornata]
MDEVGASCLVGVSVKQEHYEQTFMVPSDWVTSTDIHFKAYIRPTTGYNAPSLIADTTCTVYLNTGMLDGWYPEGSTGNIVIPSTSFVANQKIKLHFWGFGILDDAYQINPKFATCPSNHSPTSKAVTPNPTQFHSNFPTPCPTDRPRPPPLPDLDGEAEISIEGLSEDDFPKDLSIYFEFQHWFFLLAYSTLGLRIILQVFLSESLKNCFSLNRHFISLFLSFGCGVRVLYIYTTDLHSSRYEQYKLYDYGLRGLNEILWFTSFAYLAFYWYELQADKFKMNKNVLTVMKTKRHMFLSILCFALVRSGRVFCETIEMKAGVFGFKGCCGVFLISFFIFTQVWRGKLLKTLKSMNERTSMVSVRRVGSVGSTGSNVVGRADKRETAMKRFTTFLMAEAVLASVNLIEHVVSIYLKEGGVISLEETPLEIFLLKVIQRSTEFLMMVFLAYLVCLKTASNNFKYDYRLPTFTVPLLCKGSGWCTNVDINEEDREDIELLNRGDTTSSMHKTQRSSSEVGGSAEEHNQRRASVEQQRAAKKKDREKRASTTATFMKNNSVTKKKKFGPVGRRGSKPSLNENNAERGVEGGRITGASPGVSVPLNTGFEDRESQFQVSNPNGGTQL